VLALLACHGAYGFEHQLAEHQPAMAQGAAHPAQPGPVDAHHTAPKGGDPGGGAMPHGGYFAVLIPMLLAVILWSWRSFRVPDAREAQRFTTRTPAPPVPYPPRGPTLYLLQVMRL
jgi:hypothetical protein